MYWSTYQADEMESAGVGRTSDCASSTWRLTGNLTFEFLPSLLKLIPTQKNSRAYSELFHSSQRKVTHY